MSEEDLSIRSPQVQRRLEAARGYCELDLPHLAREEIEPLRGRFAGSPEFLELEMTISMQEQLWEQAFRHASGLREKLPAHPAGWLQGAYCLHEMRRTPEALQWLQEAPPRLRQEAIYHYNLACYLAVLARPEEALASLRKALKMDPAFLKSARSDPDLLSLQGRF